MRPSLTTQQSLAPQASHIPEPSATPEQRWRAAVASVPLESPRAFPTSLRPLIARLAGSADRAAYTTGPATRRALSAAGALGATTGGVVHLPTPPSTDPAKIGVLAHELSHARNPVTRPRFLLSDPGGAMDADERSARSVGDEIQSTARRAAGAPGPIVQRLLSGGSNVLGGLRDRATGAVGSAGNQLGSAASGIGGQVGSIGSRVADTAGGLGDRAGSQAESVSAGLVDTLRVGGAGAAGIVDSVRSAGSGLLGSASDAIQDAGGEADAKARAMLAQLDALAGNAGSAAGQFAGAAMSTVDGAVSGAENAVGGAVAQGQGLLNQAQGAAAGPANRAAGGLASAANLAAGDLDKIVEALEERLLRELERRGGRYAGVF